MLTISIVVVSPSKKPIKGIADFVSRSLSEGWQEVIPANCLISDYQDFCDYPDFAFVILIKQEI